MLLGEEFVANADIRSMKYSKSQGVAVIFTHDSVRFEVECPQEEYRRRLLGLVHWEDGFSTNALRKPFIPQDKEAEKVEPPDPWGLA